MTHNQIENIATQAFNGLLEVSKKLVLEIEGRAIKSPLEKEFADKFVAFTASMVLFSLTHKEKNPSC